jgi:putative membrane protein
MISRLLLAGFHLLALGIGLGAVWARGRALTLRLDPAGLRSVFLTDNFWGLAAALWLRTGLWRLLAGLEKDTAYYFHNHVFLGKMALFVTILALEIRPMITLIGWRRRVTRGEQPDITAAPTACPHRLCAGRDCHPDGLPRRGYGPRVRCFLAVQLAGSGDSLQRLNPSRVVAGGLVPVWS